MPDDDDGDIADINDTNKDEELDDVDDYAAPVPPAALPRRNTARKRPPSKFMQQTFF